MTAFLSLSRTPSALLILLLLCFISYGNVFSHAFLLDDYVNLIGPDNLSTVPYHKLLTQEFKGYYRPFPFVSLKSVLLLSGTNTAGYHLYNLLLFYGIIVLFYFIIKRLHENPFLALLVSALFAAHPINNMLINYKTASNFSLFVLFLQSSTLMFLIFLKNRKVYAYWLSVFFYGGSLLSHEISFLLPVYLFLILHFFTKDSLKVKLRLILPFAPVFMVFLAYRFQIHHSSDLIHLVPSVGPFQAIGTVTKLWLWYIAKLFLPWRIIFIWDERLVQGWEAAGYGIIFLIFVGMNLLAFFRYRKKTWAFCLNLFSIGLLPEFLAGFSYTPAMKTAIIEPQWFTFTSIGFFLGMGLLLFKLKNILSERIWMAGCGGIILLLALTTCRTNTVWRDSASYCRYWMDVNALNGTVWYCLADNFQKAYDQGLAPSKYRDCQTPALLGLSFHVQSNAAQAVNYYNLALSNGGCPAAYYGLAILYEELEDWERAGWMRERGRRIDSEALNVYELLRQAFLNFHSKDTGRKLMNILSRPDFSQGFQLNNH